MALTYSIVGFDEPEAVDLDMIKGFVYNLERLLGAQSGTLDEFFTLFG